MPRVLLLDSDWVCNVGLWQASDPAYSDDPTRVTGQQHMVSSHSSGEFVCTLFCAHVRKHPVDMFVVVVPCGGVKRCKRCKEVCYECETEVSGKLLRTWLEGENVTAWRLWDLMVDVLPPVDFCTDRQSHIVLC